MEILANIFRRVPSADQFQLNDYFKRIYFGEVDEFKVALGKPMVLDDYGKGRGRLRVLWGVLEDGILEKSYVIRFTDGEINQVYEGFIKTDNHDWKFAKSR